MIVPLSGSEPLFLSDVPNVSYASGSGSGRAVEVATEVAVSVSLLVSVSVSVPVVSVSGVSLSPLHFRVFSFGRIHTSLFQ